MSMMPTFGTWFIRLTLSYLDLVICVFLLARSGCGRKREVVIIVCSAHQAL
jgi:hypothetical protein